MPAKNKPYEQFGPYLLFRKLESDALSELWRAGRLNADSVETVVALRRFTGGSRDALLAAADAASEIVPLLTGTSFVRNQTTGAIDGVPYLAYDYSGGRSLRHIVDRSRGAAGAPPNPLPLDQAIAIAEKAALSLATTFELKIRGNRLLHGALIPQLVWIADDGEIRVAGQQFGSALIASLGSAAVRAELAGFVAPELLPAGTPSKASEVYALGALFHLLVTGAEPPDSGNAALFAERVRGAQTTAGQPLPADIRAVLERSLALDPAARYGSVAELKAALSALVNGGQYAATTFNLAFYLSTLLKKELDAEAIERERESKVNLVPYFEPPPLERASEPAETAGDEPRKSRALLATAATLLVAAAGTGAYFMARTKAGSATPKPLAAQAVPARPLIVSPPLIAAVTPAGNAPADAAAAEKQAFENAVEQKLQEEMMKLQKDYTKGLQQQQSRQAPVAVASAPVPAPSSRPAEEPLSAAQLDQQHLSSRLDSPAPQAAASVPAQSPASATASLPESVVAPVHDGDILDVGSVDVPPHVVRGTPPMYPPMALRAKVETTVIVTALVDEKGDVIEARVLRGDKRFGFEDAALRAVRSTKFTPAVKDGHRVKTWFPIPVTFKM